MSVPTVDSALTCKVLDHAITELGADLVGIANIERFEKAPLMMSPQGIMPTAKSVIVMAIRHPDGCIEMGGINHPQEIGPYTVQYLINDRLDEMSYRMGVFLEKKGFSVVPIVSSNIWRYKGYKDLKEHFAPDVSHMHAAVAAGLADFGYSGLAITPEFGGRQRYVTVITDAVLQPSPLIEPGSVCDRCNLCVKNCRSGALSKEIDGLNVVEIEGKKYTYAKKNLWRCSWGEHFDLDLDLPIPEHVDEDVILKNLHEHGTRGGEMGSCLRYCLPKATRSFDRAYTNAPRRKRNRQNPDIPNRIVFQKLSALASKQGADFTMVSDKSELESMGIALSDYLPNGSHMIVFGLHYAKPNVEDSMQTNAREYLLAKLSYDATKLLEDNGYDAVCNTSVPLDIYEGNMSGILPERRLHLAAVITNAPIPSTSRTVPTPMCTFGVNSDMTSILREFLHDQGADIVGISPASRLECLHSQISDIFDGNEHLIARDTAKGLGLEYSPEIHSQTIRVLTPNDHLPGAKSVVVIGLRLPNATITRTALPPAEAVGPHVFAQYESASLVSLMALRASRLLEDAGYHAVASFDVTGTSSFVATPRGEMPDLFSSRFEAVAAGLGHIGRGGFVITPEYGPNVRFIAIVTDADLSPNDVSQDKSIISTCTDCTRCIDTCRTHAFGREVSVRIEGIDEKFSLIDRNLCDWAKRYSLVPEEGGAFLGWDMNVPIPESVTAEKLADGLKQHPLVGRVLPCNFEACIVACPLAHGRNV